MIILLIILVSLSLSLYIYIYIYIYIYVPVECGRPVKSGMPAHQHVKSVSGAIPV